MPSDLIRGWIPVRVRKTRQNKRLELRSDSIGTEEALVILGYLAPGPVTRFLFPRYRPQGFKAGSEVIVHPSDDVRNLIRKLIL
jgi:hypothetical protein